MRRISGVSTRQIRQLWRVCERTYASHREQAIIFASSTIVATVERLTRLTRRVIELIQPRARARTFQFRDEAQDTRRSRSGTSQKENFAIQRVGELTRSLVSGGNADAFLVPALKYLSRGTWWEISLTRLAESTAPACGPRRCTESSTTK